MKSSLLSILAWPVLLTACISEASAATDAASVLAPKGERTLTVSFTGASLRSDNSSILLLAQDINAHAGLLRIAPSFEFAYRDNSSIGLRLGYASASVLSQDAVISIPGGGLSLDLPAVQMASDLLSAEFFHRNYIGVDDSGTFGFFCEFSLGYARTGTFPFSETGKASRLGLAFRPGVELYVFSSVSIEGAVGLADITYGNLAVPQSGDMGGTASSFRCAMGFNLMNCSLAIAYHF